MKLIQSLITWGPIAACILAILMPITFAKAFAVPADSMKLYSWPAASSEAPPPGSSEAPPPPPTDGPTYGPTVGSEAPPPGSSEAPPPGSSEAPPPDSTNGEDPRTTSQGVIESTTTRGPSPTLPPPKQDWLSKLVSFVGFNNYGTFTINITTA